MAFDKNDPADLLALKTEVNTDPLALGYNPADTQGGVLDIINEVRVSAPTFEIAKPKISPERVRATCTYDAYNNLSIDEQEWIRWMTGTNGFQEETMDVTVDLKRQIASVDTAGVETGGGSDSIWAPADRVAMNAAMRALMFVPGSRAEDLFGFGTTISREDWLAARDS